MKYYIYLHGNVAAESIPEFDPAFPNVPITARFAADFLAACVKSDGPIQSGWIYESATGGFSEPPPPVSEPIPDVPTKYATLLEERITELEQKFETLASDVAVQRNAVLGGKTS